jgi:drug/metabolite transporter (DMT)-like permease
MSERRLDGKVVAALLFLYIGWGSTYLAIRIAIETIPPFYMAGSRYFVSGIALLLILISLKCFRISKRGILDNVLVGGLLLLGGNGLITWAQQRVPSGITTLFVATGPVMIVFLDWAILYYFKSRGWGEQPNTSTFVGILLAILGLAALLWPSLQPEMPAITQKTDHHDILVPWINACALCWACLNWSTGSLYSRYVASKDPPMSGAAIQMIAASLMMMLTGYLLGEGEHYRWSDMSWRSIFAWCYLLIVGSLVGYSLFIWLVSQASPTLVSTYGYVNPVIALFLGWLLLNEPMNLRIVLSAATILVGVAMIAISKAKR